MATFEEEEVVLNTRHRILWGVKILVRVSLRF